MIQPQLPIFPSGLTLINSRIGFEKRGDCIYYFHGQLPVYSHEEHDLDSFRFITSQLVITGAVKQIEIVKAFGVPYISVKRSVKRLRERGIQGFSRTTPKKRSAHVLTPEVLEHAQQLLSEGKDPPEVARELGLKANTVRKAIGSGRLRQKKTSQKNKG